MISDLFAAINANPDAIIAVDLQEIYHDFDGSNPSWEGKSH